AKKKTGKAAAAAHTHAAALADAARKVIDEDAPVDATWSVSELGAATAAGWNASNSLADAAGEAGEGAGESWEVGQTFGMVASAASAWNTAAGEVAKVAGMVEEMTEDQAVKTAVKEFKDATNDK